jgi:hypothetical protein
VEYHFRGNFSFWLPASTTKDENSPQRKQCNQQFHAGPDPASRWGRVSGYRLSPVWIQNAIFEVIRKNRFEQIVLGFWTFPGSWDLNIGIFLVLGLWDFEFVSNFEFRVSALSV